MKKIKIFYWIVTGLFLLMMTFSGIASLASREQSMQVFNSINMPSYLIPFISIAKILGVIAILVPGYPRLKEWAYAGLIYDLIGAAYCNYSVGKPAGECAPILIFLAIAFASYFLYHKKVSPQPR